MLNWYCIYGRHVINIRVNSNSSVNRCSKHTNVRLVVFFNNFKHSLFAYKVTHHTLLHICVIMSLLAYTQFMPHTGMCGNSTFGSAVRCFLGPATELCSPTTMR